MKTREYVFVLGVMLCLPGCRLLSREVACYRDLDCPQDAGISFCERPSTEADAGVGRCIVEDPNPPVAAIDGGPLVVFPDAGEADDAGDDENAEPQQGEEGLTDAGSGDDAG